MVQLGGNNGVKYSAEYFDNQEYQSKSCEMGTTYLSQKNATKCVGQLDTFKPDPSGIRFVDVYVSSGGKFGGHDTYTVATCKPGDKFTWEPTGWPYNRKSLGCVSALVRKTGIVFEAAETDRTLGFFGDFVAYPILSGSVFSDYSALLQKFQK